MHRLVLCLALCSAASPAAEVYRWVDPDGNTQYSDQPRPNAEVIRIPKAPAASAPAPTPAAAPAGDPAPSDPAAPKFAGYDTIAVVNPPNDGTVWDNSGNVSIEIAVAPALQGTLGHKLVVLLNGTPLGAPIAATSFTVTNLDRDTYTLQARIVDAGGEVLGESPPSVFHMKRISLLAPAAPPAALPQPQQRRLPRLPQPRNAAPRPYPAAARRGGTYSPRGVWILRPCTAARHRHAPPTIHRIPGHERKPTILLIYLILGASVLVRQGTHRRGAPQGKGV